MKCLMLVFAILMAVLGISDSKKTNFILMPYPIFKDASGKELFILGKDEFDEKVDEFKPSRR